MLLIKLTVNAVVKRISDRLLGLENPWYPYVKSFTPPQYQTQYDSGGFVRMGPGSITISRKAFESDWPPPVQCEITAQYTATTEAAADTMFTSVAHQTGYTRDDATYKIQDLEYSVNLLTEKDDYDENAVYVPKGIGAVTHVTPTRLPDVDIGGGYGEAPTYDLGDVSISTYGFKIIAFSRASGGTATKVTVGDVDGNPVNPNYSNGETVYIVKADNMNGAHVISNVSGATFTIPVAYANESQPIFAGVYQAGDFQAYDDGLPIFEKVHNNANGTFSLKSRPVGQVTISGATSITTLDDLASWVQSELGIGSYDNTYARSPSPAISKWETSQQTVLDFLSKACQPHTHLFYIKNDTLYLVDMYRDNGSRTLTNFEFHEKPKYGKFAPVKKLSSKWNTYSAKTGTSGGPHDLTTSHYIKTTEHDISEDVYEYGNEVSIPAFNDSEDAVKSCLVMVRDILIRDKVTISIPAKGDIPVPGEKLSWTDSTLPVDIPGYIRARIISYDFIRGRISITGDGLFLQPAEMGRKLGDVAVSGATTETIDSFDHSIAKGAVWDYIVDDGSRTNMRMGRISAVWDQSAGSTPKIIHRQSEDIGTTFGIVSFDVDKSSDTVRLRCTSTSGSWQISGSRKYIGLQ